MQISIIQNKIYEIRGQKVMLDFDLADLYEVSTKALKQAVNRNKKRFPPDFMFVLNKKEFQNLRSQIVTSKRGGTRYMPYAFTEQGVAMLSSVLNSEKAIQVNIVIIRTFVLLRQVAISYNELADKIKKLEKKYHKDFKQIFQALDFLLSKKQQEKQKEEDYKNRKRIGYKTD
jgi:hypothetical protein